MNQRTDRRVSLLALLFLLYPVAAPAQQMVKAPTLRDEVRQKGSAYRIFVNDYEIELTLDGLIASSDAIVLGRVVDEKTRLSDDEYQVFTDYTVEVMRVFKDVGGQLKDGDRIIASRMGGNLVLEGHPVRDENMKFPTLPWITPRIFLLAAQEDPRHRGWYDFTGQETSVFPILNAQIDCGSKTKPKNPVIKPFCGMSQENFEALLEDKVAALGNTRSTH